jgi:thiamine transport system substrate-binding protein
LRKLIALVISTLVLAGCASQATLVRLATHDSFAISEELISKFESDTGFELEIIRLGDTGTLTNQLILTRNAPVADAYFGIDNTFRSVAEAGDITSGDFVAVDYSDVCFNYDIAWFEAAGINPPTSWRELTDPDYRSLTVVTDPKLSSPGLAFLATTFAGFEDSSEVVDYWTQLRDNEVRVAGSWEDAYFVDFTRYGGDRPIVLSYASSPSAEVSDGLAGTAALLDECFRQIEYAGVLQNTPNQSGAEAIVEFLLSEEFQASVPESMYVYPAVKGISVPEQWAKFALPANSTLGDAALIETNREQWLSDWTAVFDD